MWGMIINALRSLLISQSNQLKDIISTNMLNNIVIKEAGQHIKILDEQGKLCRVRRYRKYKIRWYSPDYFSPQRITLESEHGRIKRLEIIKPKGLTYKILEGGIGKKACVFHIRAPKTSPTYMIRMCKSQYLVAEYDAINEYTKNVPKPHTWAFRLGKGQPMPRKFNFKLTLPKEKPLLLEPRVYRLDNLTKIEYGYTDESLTKLNGWQRLSDSEFSKESYLKINTDLTYVKWQVRPFKTDVAYKIEWDWGE